MKKHTATPEQIAEWKKKHGSIKLATLETETETREIIIRKPNRTELGEAEKFEQRDPNRAREILINACVLTDVDAVKADDALFYAASKAINQLLPDTKAILLDL